MPSSNTYHLSWVSLTLEVGVSLHGCSSKAQLLLLILDEGYLLTSAIPDLQCGIAPLGPPLPMQPLLLGHVNYSQNFHFKITELATRFNPETVLRQDTILLYNPCKD